LGICKDRATGVTRVLGAALIRQQLESDEVNVKQRRRHVTFMLSTGYTLGVTGH